MKRGELVGGIAALLEEMQAGLHARARAFRDANVRPIDGRTDFEAFFTAKNEREIHGGFALSRWCGDASCEAGAKEALKVTIRCIPFVDGGSAGTPASAPKPPGGGTAGAPLGGLPRRHRTLRALRQAGHGTGGVREGILTRGDPAYTRRRAYPRADRRADSRRRRGGLRLRALPQGPAVHPPGAPGHAGARQEPDRPRGAPAPRHRSRRRDDHGARGARPVRRGGAGGRVLRAWPRSRRSYAWCSRAGRTGSARRRPWSRGWS